MAEIDKINTCTPKRIAIYVIFDKDGILDGFRKYYLQELRKEVDSIIGVVQGTLTPESRRELEELTNDFFVRENTGLLTYAWIEGIKYIGWDKLAKYDELLMLNDSFFGPFFPLKDFFEACEKSDADFYGVMKNFEEKAFTEMAGRALKHGYFRGSICYFYIIKSRLLHSPEFKRYWEEKPSITCDWDTYFFNEMNFYDYVIDAGFKIDAYQSDKLKGYFFDNLTHNMRKLVEDEKIPYARIRPFATDMKEQSMQINYGKDPRQTLDYIDKYTNYDVNLIWDFILRTKNITNIWNQLQLEYVIPKDIIEKTYTYEKRIAVILHIYYTDLVDHIADYCCNFPSNTDFYITTIKNETKIAIDKSFQARGLTFQCQTRPNVGVAMSTLWVTYADVVTHGKYEYICYFHDKKSPYSQYAVQGEQFAERCYENLFGTPSIVKNIINLFEDNPRMGILGAPIPYHGDYFSVCQRSWQGNIQNTIKLAKRIGLKVDINPDTMPVAPYGDMFWFRAKALKKSIGYGLKYEDFDVPYKHDFTFMHAIERIYSFCAQDSGYYYADVINTDNARSDLINYQYIISTVFNAMISRGIHPYNFDVFKRIINEKMSITIEKTCNNQISSNLKIDRNMLKKIIKFQYYRYRILSKITFGNRRKRYKQKKTIFKELVNSI